jgi:hypothetical protein
MGWFQANRRGGGAVALLALAFQFVVAFAHVHLHAGHDVPVTAVFAGSPEHADEGPSHEGGDRDHRLGCDVCTTLDLSGTAHAAPAPLPAPASVATAPLPIVGEALAERRYSHAQSRAPPNV